MNVGSTDKMIRIILGVIVAVAGWYYHTWWGLLAIVLLGTAFMRTCPAYSLFGINTSKKN